MTALKCLIFGKLILQFSDLQGCFRNKRVLLVSELMLKMEADIIYSTTPLCYNEQY